MERRLIPSTFGSKHPERDGILSSGSVPLSQVEQLLPAGQPVLWNVEYQSELPDEFCVAAGRESAGLPHHGRPVNGSCGEALDEQRDPLLVGYPRKLRCSAQAS